MGAVARHGLRRLPFQFKECTLHLMAFISQIPTQVPGLNHLAAVNDKLLKPGLSVVQTAKGYVDTMRKEKPEPVNQTHTIIIDRLPRRDTSPYESIDHEFTDGGSAQRQRVQELLDTRSLNPPFPNKLPKRPQKKQPFNRWKLGFFGMLLIFAAAVVPLAILATRSSNAGCDPDQPGQQSQATVTETTTQVSLVTLTTVRVTTRLSTSTEVTVRTTLITDVAEATGIGSSKD